MRLSDRLYVYAVHHIAEQKNKKNVKICMQILGRT